MTHSFCSSVKLSVCTLSLLNFLVEFIDDNGNEQVHDEEGGEENEEDKDDGDQLVVSFNWYVIESYTVDVLSIASYIIPGHISRVEISKNVIIECMMSL